MDLRAELSFRIVIHPVIMDLLSQGAHKPTNFVDPGNWYKKMGLLHSQQKTVFAPLRIRFEFCERRAIFAPFSLQRGMQTDQVNRQE
jgi:hypothetical protein